MSQPYILLWLEGPLQSWGFDSRFGRRDTQTFPTKSGVLGLVCCASGRSGEQREFLAKFAELDLCLVAYEERQEHRQENVFSPILRDFHMVGSGYDSADNWQSLMIPKTSLGKSSVGGGAKLTYRYYLQNACFAVALQVPKEHVEEIANRLQNPVWDLYLGRKCCAPSEIIFQGIFDSIDALNTKAQQLATNKGKQISFRVLQGEYQDADELITLNDVPIQFGQVKRYRERRISIIRESSFN